MPTMLVISRQADTHRRQGMQERVPSSLDWSFLDASDGHRPEALPSWSRRLLAETFWNGPNIKPGAFGCFLSHYRAWQESIRLGHPLIIAEDDVFFLRDIDLSEVERDCAGFDVTFLNRRAVKWRNLVPEMVHDARPETLPLRDVVEAVAAARIEMDKTAAPGADFYRVTPAGAAQLIASADANGSVVGLDWFIVGCCLNGALLAGPWKEPALAARRIDQRVPVHAGILSQPLAAASTKDAGGSVISHSSALPIADYRARIGLAG